MGNPGGGRQCRGAVGKNDVVFVGKGCRWRVLTLARMCVPCGRVEQIAEKKQGVSAAGNRLFVSGLKMPIPCGKGCGKRAGRSFARCCVLFGRMDAFRRLILKMYRQQLLQGSRKLEIKKAPGACASGALQSYSHSMVDGGLEEMSYTTRLTPFTSLMMRPEILASRSAGRRAQSAVMASTLSTMRRAMTCS